MSLSNQLFWALAGAAWFLIPAVRAADKPPAMVKPIEVRRVYSDSKHNAFTALARFRNQYWLAFRTGKDHNSADGDILVLQSRDARTWTMALRLDLGPDDRDPQFLVTDKRLFLYDPVMRGRDLTTFVVFTEDGHTWSKP